jgi:hypothetical protein
LAAKVFEAAINYYKAARIYLDEAAKKPPSIRPFLKVRHGSLFDIRVGAPDEFGPKLHLYFEDQDIRAECRKRGPRWFPEEYLPALLLLTSPGGSIRHNYRGKKDRDGKQLAPDKRKSHLTFGRGAGQNVRLLRIMFDARGHVQIQRRKRTGDDWHREYRPAALETASVNHQGRPVIAEKGRKDAFRFAGQHWEIVRKRGRALPSGMTADEFAATLLWAFDIADELYRKRREKLR